VICCRHSFSASLLIDRFTRNGDVFGTQERSFAIATPGYALVLLKNSSKQVDYRFRLRASIFKYIKGEIKTYSSGNGGGEKQ
jgi:hypothetical protein